MSSPCYLSSLAQIFSHSGYQETAIACKGDVNWYSIAVRVGEAFASAKASRWQSLSERREGTLRERMKVVAYYVGAIDTSSTSNPSDYSIQPVSIFTGVVMASDGINIRSGPGINYDAINLFPYGKELSFDASATGDPITDVRLGTPDNQWFRIEGTNYWVPSAYVDGDPGRSVVANNQDNGDTGSTTSSVVFISPGYISQQVDFSLRNQSINGGGNGSSIGGFIEPKIDPLKWKFSTGELSLF
jgi:uncharacterized protein YraI